MSEVIPESTEKENKPKTDLNSLLNQAKHDFLDEGLSRGGDFLDIESSDFESKSISSFLAFLNGNSNYSILATELVLYTDEQKKSVSSQLKQELIKGSVKIEKNRKTLQKQFEEEFKIISGDKIEKNLKKLKSSNIQALINSELKRKQFIIKNYKKEQFTEIDQKNNLLEKINIELIDKDKLSDEQQMAIVKFSEGKNKLYSSEYLDLLSVFEKKEKVNILKYFNNSFNLNTLLEYGIIDRVKAYGLLKQSIKKTYPKLKNEDIEKYFPSLEGDTNLLKEINISVSELEKMGDKPLEKLIENEKALTTLFDSLNEIKEKEFIKIQGDLNKYLELDENGNINQNFKNFIKEDINNDVVQNSVKSSIDNFGAGNYLNKKINGVDSYYYIEAVDLGSTIEGKKFKVKDLTPPFGKGLLKAEHVNGDLFSYEKLYDLFKSSSNIEEFHLEFISKENFNTKEKNGEIELNDSVDNISSEEDLKKKLIEKGNLESGLENIPLSELCFLDDVHKKDEPFFRSFQAVGGDKLVFEGSNQEMSFSAFFAEIQKGGKEKYKFENRILSAEEIGEKDPLNSIALHKDGKKFVLKGDKNDSKANEINYFIKDNVAIHINKVSRGDIEYSIGEMETKSKEGQDEKKEIIKIFKSKHNYNGLNQFIHDIKNKGFKPDLEGKTIEGKDDENDIFNKEQSNTDIIGKILKNASFAELLQGGKMVIDTLEQHFEHGSKLKAAKFAEKMGVLVSDKLKVKLKAKSEKESQELMKERVEAWTQMDSNTATKDIKETILFNPNAENDDILAAMMYMAEKDGSLYAKNLGKFRSTVDKGYSSFLWFRKMGGTKAEYEKAKAKHDNSDPTKSTSGREDPNLFTEEAVMVDLLAGLAKKGIVPSKIHKSFWGKMEEGHKKRMEKGVEETANLHTASDKVEYVIKYWSKGEGSRGVGAMEKTLAKDSDRYSMNSMPFVLGMSGISKDFSSPLVQKLHQLDGTTAYPTIEMMKSIEGVELYQNSILAFLKESGHIKEYNELIGIKSEPLENNQIKPLHSFFMKNKEILTDFITLKDGFAATRRNKNPILGKYYDRIKAKFKDDEYELNEDSTKARTFENSGAADTNCKYDKVVINQNGSLMNVISRRFFDVYTKRLEQIMKLPSTGKVGISDSQRKKLWLNVYKPFMDHIAGELSVGYSRSQGNEEFYATESVRKLLENKLIIPFGKSSIQKIGKDNFYDKAYDVYNNVSDLEKYKNEIGIKDNDIPNTISNTQNLMDLTINPSKIDEKVKNPIEEDNDEK